MYRRGKSTETESRLMVSRDSRGDGSGKWEGVTADRLAVMKMF